MIAPARPGLLLRTEPSINEAQSQPYQVTLKPRSCHQQWVMSGKACRDQGRIYMYLWRIHGGFSQSMARGMPLLVLLQMQSIWDVFAVTFLISPPVHSAHSLGTLSPTSLGGVPSSLILCVSWATPWGFLQVPDAPRCFPTHLTAPHAFTCLVLCLPQPFAHSVLHQLLLASHPELSLSPMPYLHPNQAACSSCQGCRHGRAPPASPLALEAVFNASLPLTLAEGAEI